MIRIIVAGFIIVVSGILGYLMERGGVTDAATFWTLGGMTTLIAIAVGLSGRDKLLGKESDNG